MPLEPDVDNIDDLVQSNPIVTDDVSEGDNHLRIIKRALQGNVAGDDLTTSLLAAGVPIVIVDGAGAVVAGVLSADQLAAAQVKATDPLPVDVDDLTRKDYVDLLSVLAGAGLVGGGVVVGNPTLDVVTGNGLQIFGGEVTMSGSFAGILNVTQQVRVSLFPVQADDLTRKDYVDGRSQGNVAQRQIVVNGVMLLAGITTAAGQIATVTYPTPFSGATPVVSLTVNAAAGNNAFAFITNSTLTGFTATVGLANAGVHWMAQGAL